ncbi:hypothetical protein Tco_0232578 [Tanacetum coccineum]
MPTEMELTLEQTQQGGSYEVSMEILLEPTSNKLMVGRSSRIRRIHKDGDEERLSRSDEVLKLKNFKKDATLKLSKSTN